jgi:superfamily I DNA/RNA helicase
LGGNDNLQIYNFHDLCYQLAERAGKLPVIPPAKDGEARRHFFDHDLPDALLDAIEELDDVQFDAIIVDEGQDFLKDWWFPLQYLLHDPDQGILYIFFDDNQRLYDRLADFPIQTPPYALSINCRNTRNIHKQVQKYYQGQERPPSAIGPKGRPVDFVRFSDKDLFPKKLKNVLQQLISDEGVPPQEIVVLTPLRRKSRLWSKSMEGSPSLTNQWPPKSDQVFATTIHDFKGLESSVIILVEAERWPAKGIDLESLLYVACSRARNHLIIFRPVMLQPKIEKYLS